ncbi:MAG TPA: GAF domain-containing protein [Gemmatimonadales bacterium]|nr:GAF domain-containing protein [Gemmatimonadales bacterium]
MEPIPAAAPLADAGSPEARIRELEQERKHLLAIIEILEEISGSLQFVDILQTITRKLGEAFGLDRCSIFLAERGGRTARLVASYEDPSIRNYIVDLERYPELKHALSSGETVFIPDASSDPKLKHVQGALATRRVQSITVVPITWKGVAIGAIFLRSFREGPSFSETDIKFTQVIGSLTAKALRNAYRYERLLHRRQESGDAPRRADRERVALVGFMGRLLEAFGKRDGFADDQLARSSTEELDRLVEIAMTVIAEEGKGR